MKYKKSNEYLKFACGTYKTIKDDEAFLRQESKEVLKGDPDLKDNIKLAKSVFDKDDNLLALALIQLGIPKKILYVKKTQPYGSEEKEETTEIIMLNPEILEEKGETYYWENCASCLDYMGYVKRPYSIKVRYQDLDFNYHEEEFTGFKSTVFSHEYDHLLGILHIDIAEKIIDMPLEERLVFRKQEENKYKIISKTCDYKHPKRKENI